MSGNQEKCNDIYYIHYIYYETDHVIISIYFLGKKKKKDKKKKHKAEALPSKIHISTPCFFNHITSVDVVDARRYYTLKEYLSNTT